MAGVSDKDLVKQTRFPAGINNRASDQDLPRDENGIVLAARSLVNVDLKNGKPVTRPGQTKLDDGDYHSLGKLIGQGMFAVKDGDLVRIVNGVPVETVRAGVGRRRLSYTEVHGDLWWSNNEVIRRIRRGDFADMPIGPDCAGVPNVAPYPGGGLVAGNYVVAVTWFDADGRESGAAGSVDLDIAEGEAIRVHGIPPAPETAVLCRIYVSPPNGSELYAAKEVAAGVTNTLITAGDERSSTRALETLWHTAFPACDHLRWSNGRLYGVDGNTIVWSPPLRPQLWHHDNYLRQGARITLFEPLENAGIWLADHKATYWLQGIDPRKDWRRIAKRDTAAARGCSIVVPGNAVGLDTTADVVVWVASDGRFCAGLPDGQLIVLKEDSLAMPLPDEGAMFMRQHEGLRQLVTAYVMRGANDGLRFSERVIATVTSHTSP